MKRLKSELYKVLLIKLVMLVGLGYYFKTHKQRVSPESTAQMFFK